MLNGNYFEAGDNALYQIFDFTDKSLMVKNFHLYVNNDKEKVIS